MLFGLWDEAKGGLGVNSVKPKVKQEKPVDQNDDSDVPNGHGQSGGQSEETPSDVPNDPNVPNGNDQNDQMD